MNIIIVTVVIVPLLCLVVVLLIIIIIDKFIVTLFNINICTPTIATTTYLFIYSF